MVVEFVVVVSVAAAVAVVVLEWQWELVVVDSVVVVVVVVGIAAMDEKGGAEREKMQPTARPPVATRICSGGEIVLSQPVRAQLKKKQHRLEKKRQRLGRQQLEFWLVFDPLCLQFYYSADFGCENLRMWMRSASSRVVMHKKTQGVMALVFVFVVVVVIVIVAEMAKAKAKVMGRERTTAWAAQRRWRMCQMQRQHAPPVCAIWWIPTEQR